MRKLVRRGLRHFRELFTPRNLVAVAHLRRAIGGVEDARIRRALLVSFTAHLAQSTRMIADFSGRAGGPSWKLNCYWLPAIWQEMNPFRYFENRVKKTVSALADMREQLGRAVVEGDDYRIWTLSAERLGERIPSGSIGYIFTDPPYGGEGIQYGELSMLWNLWAGEAIGLEREVAYNPRQKKDEEAYARRLTECLAAGFEALAPGGFASVTFANKDPRVWEALLGACAKVGFVLKSRTRMAPSAPNLTNILSEGAPKEDADSELSEARPAGAVSEGPPLAAKHGEQLRSPVPRGSPPLAMPEIEPQDDPWKLCGTTIEGKYRVASVVGDGGFGVVYRGVHKGFGELIAIKCLKLPAQPRREAARGAARAAPGRGQAAPPALQADRRASCRRSTSARSPRPTGAWVPYLVLEWLEGETLAEHLKAGRSAGEGGLCRSPRPSSCSSRRRARSPSRTRRRSPTATSSRRTSS